MSNESINELSVAVNNLLKTVGTLVQQEIELVKIGIKAAGQVLDFVVKTSSDLACNAVNIGSELSGNILNTTGRAAQNVTSALTPKK
jgi:hypothetical protein